MLYIVGVLRFKPCMTSKDILLAKIGAAHGVKGEVRVKSFTDDPVAFGDYGKLHDASGRKYEVLKARLSKTIVVTRFKSIDTREKAEALNGIELFIDRAMLPEIGEEDEFYMSDLIGLDVLDEAGAKIGTLTAVHDFGAGVIVEVRPLGGGEILYPFTKAIVPKIDIAAGVLTIIPPLETSEREEGEREEAESDNDGEGS